MAFALGVDEAVGVAAEAVHVAQAFRNPPVAHQDHHLVERFRTQRPEIPTGRIAAHVVFRVALLGVDEVRELERVADKEHRGVVSHQVPVAFVGVKLQGEPPYVALRVGGPPFAGHGRKTGQHGGLFPDFGKDRGFGVAGDVVRDGEGSERPGAFGMNDPFRNPLAVEVAQLFEVPHVLQQGGARMAGRFDVLVVGHGFSGGRRQTKVLGAFHDCLVFA